MKSQELSEKDKLYQEIEFNIDHIKSKKNKYVLTYRSAKTLVFIAGATITVLTGYKKSIDSQFEADNIILIISAAITLYAAIEGLFDLKDKALSYDILLFELRKLRSQMSYDFYKDENIYSSKKDTYFKDFQEILHSQKSIIENSYENAE